MIIPTLASRSTTAAPTFANGTTTNTNTPSHATPSTAATRAVPTPGDSNTRTLIITTAVLGGALVLLVLCLVMFFLLRRRRRQKATQQHYQEARARDPTLTWDDYLRRQKLTHSRLFLEEELQRDLMIRKSLQSRTSVNTTGAARPPLPPPVKKPRRMRSRSWHAGQTLSHDDDPAAPQRPLPSADAAASPSSSAPPEMLEEHREGFRQEWRDIEASLEQTWEILTGKRHPSLDDARAPLIRGGARGGGAPHAAAAAAADDTASSLAPSRPPTVRLKTPPLFRIHPAFRRGSKHASLPAQFHNPAGSGSGGGGGVVS